MSISRALPPQMIEVGEFTYGHERIEVIAWDNQSAIRIGSFCSFAQNIRILTGGNHSYKERISTYPFMGKGRVPADSQGDAYSNGHVTIGHDVWVGLGVTIMSGVTIGTGAIIAAGSHVVKDVGPYEIHGGNPAKLIRTRFTPEQVDKLLNSRWWEYRPIEDIAPILRSKDVDGLISFLESIKNA